MADWTRTAGKFGEQGIYLSSQRLLRRILRRGLGIARFGAEVPHTRCLSWPRDSLHDFAEAGEFAVPTGGPATVVLVVPPEASLYSDPVAEEMELWRRAFHGLIHRELEGLTLSQSRVQALIHALGQTEFDEIRMVLRQDHHLLPGAGDLQTYVEFVALYLELFHFAPPECDGTFPALAGIPQVLNLDKLGLRVPELLEASRPVERALSDLPQRAKAHGHGHGAPPSSHGPGIVSKVSVAPAPLRPEDEQRPNRVADIARLAGAGDARGAEGALRELVERLCRGLSLPKRDIEDATANLKPLLTLMAQGSDSRWSRPVRFLYDVQSACIAAEREIFAIDPVGFVSSFGKRAVRRPLPVLRTLRMFRALKSAYKKLGHRSLSASLGPAADALVASWVTRAEQIFRSTLRGPLRDTLAEVGLRPTNLPERVAANAIVEELLDHAAAHGFLSLGTLRDAISSSDLKLGNLSARELISGDALLCADDRLSVLLDGVYRSGELYMRGLQKLSSTVFGTSPGRFLAIYLLGPLVFAFVVLEGLQHVIGPLLHKLAHIHVHLLNKATLLVLAIYLGLVLHVPVVRRVSASAFGLLGRLLRGLFVEMPKWFFALSLVRKFLASGAYQLLMRFLVKPLALGALGLFVLRAFHVPWLPGGIAAGALYLVAVFFLSTHVGMLAEEYLVDNLSRRWAYFTRRLLPGLARLLVDFFAWVVSGIERGLYAVDERLRFRKGESPFAMVAKGAFGTLWFFVTYLTRIYVNLLVEPQVNPIKHFPVVTVSHKMMIPFLKSAYLGLFAATSWLLPASIATPLTATTVFLLPGFFGFLAWELKENFKLYSQNRPKALGPIRIGSHGESMVALLRPGFHSGTIPKLYLKLRRATVKQNGSASKFEHELSHVSECVSRFVDRRLVDLLARADTWRGGALRIETVALSSNRVRVTLRRGDEISSEGSHADPDLVLTFEEQSGWLLADVSGTLLEILDLTSRTTLDAALTGLFKLAGVDMVRAHLEGQLPEGSVYDIADEGLVVWTGESRDEALYVLSHDMRDGMLASKRGKGPSLDPSKLLFRAQTLSWSSWTSRWESGTPGGLTVLRNATPHGSGT